MKGMEESRLHEASLKGSVESLKELLQEDPLLLDRVIIDCPRETPLHVAATLGGSVTSILPRKLRVESPNSPGKSTPKGIHPFTWHPQKGTSNW
uniref:Uncharacterized protein n=1 Tax=Nelumbo nucifera TaxID=4432 RepID=A0A822Z3L9_NELNU|nr:TPA_asm: hypothetical protein HUJ06_013955 [Nelumbo nucifera]